MGLFSSKPKQKLKNINGYTIDELTGRLIDVPKGLQVYNIPREAKQLDPNLNLRENKVLSSMSGASEINFEDGSIDKIPAGYFTFGATFPNLKKLTLPNGIKSLGDNCIDSTRTKFNLPDSIEHLGKNMYPEVQGLVIGNNIKSLGHGFASHDTNLVYVEVAGSIKELPTYFVNQCKNVKTLILHEGIESANTNAFRNLNGLEYVELPDSFKMPFQTSMEHRPGSNKRGNSKYDGANFEAQQNSILTIRKVHNGIPYTFQVRRGDFEEISFQNMMVFIRSSNSEYGNINIDLAKLSPNTICRVDIQNKKVQQIQQPVQNQARIEPNSLPQQQMSGSEQPINNQLPQSKPKPEPKLTGDPLDSSYTDEEIDSYIQELWKEYIYKFDSYNALNPRDQVDVSILLNREMKKRLQKMKRGKRFEIDAIDYLFDGQLQKLNEPKVNKSSQDSWDPFHNPELDDIFNHNAIDPISEEKSRVK